VIPWGLGVHHQLRHLDHVAGNGSGHYRPRRSWRQGDFFDHYSERDRRIVPGPELASDAKILEIGEGTSEVQRMLIARELGLGHSSARRAELSCG